MELIQVLLCRFVPAGFFNGLAMPLVFFFFLRFYQPISVGAARTWR